MNDNEAVVRISADASAVAPGVQHAAGEIQGLAPLIQQMSAQFAELAATIKESMAQGAAGSARMVEEMKVLESETEKENLSLRAMVGRINEVGEGFMKFRSHIMSIGRLWMEVFAVEMLAHWAEGMANAAEKVTHLSVQLGMTAAQIQQLQGVAAATGVSMDAITKGLGILDKNAVNSAGSLGAVSQSMKAVGVSAMDGQSNMQRLLAVADKFKDMPDGPTKTALAMELFGRSGKELIPVLNLGSKGIEELTEKTKEYGGVNTEAIARGQALAESVNESKLAWNGLKQTLMDEFAPLLERLFDGFNNMVKAMTASYNAGGAVKVVFDLIVDAANGVGEVIASIGDAFGFFFSSTAAGGINWKSVIQGAIELVVTTIKLFIVLVVTLADGFVIQFHQMEASALQWWSTLVVAFDKVMGTIHVTIASFKAFAAVAYDALTMHWSSIAADWQAGMQEIDATVRREGQKIVNDATRIKNEANAQLALVGSMEKGLSDWSHKFMEPHAATAKTGIELPHGGGGEAPDIRPQHKGHEKKEKDDLVQKLDEELKAKETAWAMEQDAQGTAQEYSLQAIADYWQRALGMANLSVKDRLGIEEKYLAARKAMLDDETAKFIENKRKEMDEARGNSAAQLSIAQDVLTRQTKIYGENSRQAKAAADEVVRVKRAAAEEQKKLAEDVAQFEAKQALAGLAAHRAVAQFRVQMGVQTEGQLIAQERDFENQRYQIESQGLQRRRALIDPLRDPQGYQKVSHEIQALELAHQQALTQIDQKAILQRTQMERGAINQFSSSWAQAISQLVTLQAGFANTLKSLYQGLQQTIGNALESIIQKWLQQHLAALLFKRAAQSVEATAAVASNAAVAGSAAFASTAAIPIVGPALAPAAAAAAYASTMAFAPLASAEGGWDIPAGVNPVTQLHKREMVLPEKFADVIRGMADGRGGGGDGGFHYHDHTGTLTPAQMLANKETLVKIMKMAHRQGAFQ